MSLNKFSSDMAQAFCMTEKKAEKKQPAQKKIIFFAERRKLANSRYAIKQTSDHQGTIRMKDGYEYMGKPTFVKLPVFECYWPEMESYIWCERAYIKSHSYLIEL